MLWLGEEPAARLHRLWPGTYRGGIALLYFTIFASFYYYDLLTSTTGMSLLILVTIGWHFPSTRTPGRWLIGLITGFLNPAFSWPKSRASSC